MHKSWIQGLTDRIGHQQVQRAKMICILFWHICTLYSNSFVKSSEQLAEPGGIQEWTSAMKSKTGTNKYNLIRLKSVDKGHPTPTTQLSVWSHSLPLGYNSTSGSPTAIESLRYICTTRQVPAPTFLEMFRRCL